MVGLLSGHLSIVRVCQEAGLILAIFDYDISVDPRERAEQSKEMLL